MELFQVNQELCTQCGVCAAVCPLGMIEMTEQGPKQRPGQGCMIACGHCVAVCPNAALDKTKTPLKNQTPFEQYPVIDAAMSKNFLRSRRSIRNYQKKKVTHATMLELLDIARFAPTANNSQGLSYLVIEDDDRLRQITEQTINWLEMQIRNEVDWAKGDTGIVDLYRKTGNDVILRGAPALVVAIAPRNFRHGHENACFSLEYVELYATALRLGTCWAGFVELAAWDRYQPLLETLQIPEAMEVVGTMMIGYPLYTYQRLVDRNPLQVTWI